MKTLLLFVLVLFVPALPAQGDTKVRFDAALRVELRKMAEADQQFREKVTFTEEEWEAVDGRNLKRMKEIIATRGWPGRSLVGDSGAAAAWILVQHCDTDIKFQEECLGLLEKAVASSEAKAFEYAYLLDRVRTNTGKPQVYGTQYVRVPGAAGEALYWIEALDTLKERRLGVGLDWTPVFEQKVSDLRKAGNVSPAK